MSSQPEMTDVARSAARLRWTVILIGALMVVVYAVARFGLLPGRVRVEHYMHGLAPGAAWLIGDGAALLLVAALYHLVLMLGRIARGELFSLGVIRHFRGFALWLLLMALFKWFGPMVAVLAQGHAGGVHELRFGFDFDEILTVGLALLLFLVARLLERARQIEDEVREFV